MKPPINNESKHKIEGTMMYFHKLQRDMSNEQIIQDMRIPAQA